MYITLAWWLVFAFLALFVLLLDRALYFQQHRNSHDDLIVLGFVIFYIIAILSCFAVKRLSRSNSIRDLEPSISYEISNQEQRLENKTNEFVRSAFKVIENTKENVCAKLNSLHSRLDRTPEFKIMQNETEPNQTL